MSTTSVAHSSTATRPYGAYAMMFIAMAMSGGNYVAAKFLNQELSPLTGASLRFVLATAILMPLLLIREGRPSKTTAHHLPTLILMGITGIFGFNALLFLGLQTTTATNASLITAAQPMAVPLFSIPLLRERLTSIQVVGIILSFLGVVYLIGQGSLTSILQMQFNIGDLLVVLSVLAAALYNTLSKKMIGIFSPVAATAWACLWGTILLALFALLDPAWQNLDRVTVVGYFAIVYMAVFGTVGTYVLFYAGMKAVPASTAAIFTNVIPLTAVVWSAILLGERLTIYVLVSAVVVLTGVFLTTQGPSLGRKRKPVALS